MNTESKLALKHGRRYVGELFFLLFVELSLGVVEVVSEGAGCIVFEFLKGGMWGGVSYR